MVDKGEVPVSDLDPEKMYGSRILRMLGVNEEASIEVNHPWYRGGAETYVSDFYLSRDNTRQHLIAKACIKFAPSETMAEWLERRKALSENGILLPELVVVDGATIVEEYIDFSFREAYESTSDVDVRAELHARYIDTFKRIVGAGFAPMSLSDVRSHGEDVVLIDVGEDIGGQSSITSCRLDVANTAESHFSSLIR